jgi:hypothetical protein
MFDYRRVIKKWVGSINNFNIYMYIYWRYTGQLPFRKKKKHKQHIQKTKVSVRNDASANWIPVCLFRFIILAHTPSKFNLAPAGPLQEDFSILDIAILTCDVTYGV